MWGHMTAASALLLAQADASTTGHESSTRLFCLRARQVLGLPHVLGRWQDRQLHEAGAVCSGSSGGGWRLPAVKCQQGQAGGAAAVRTHPPARCCPRLHCHRAGPGMRH